MFWEKHRILGQRYTDFSVLLNLKKKKHLHIFNTNGLAYGHTHCLLRECESSSSQAVNFNHRKNGPFGNMLLLANPDPSIITFTSSPKVTENCERQFLQKKN